MDTFSKSDPCKLLNSFGCIPIHVLSLDVVVHLRTNKSHPWLEVCYHTLLSTCSSHQAAQVGRTEVIADNSNPAFATAVEVDYLFEQLQYIRFSV
jgi:hypothetical protein